MSANRILVVDDSKIVRRMFGVFLSSAILDSYVQKSGRRGVSVEYACNGREGLSMLTASKDFDVVILDLDMPEMNGFEFLAEQRRIASIADVPVIVVSAMDGEDVRKRVLDAGAYAHFKKTFEPTDFYAAVQGALRTEVHWYERVAHGSTA